jgi:prevent-host-death family protein
MAHCGTDQRSRREEHAHDDLYDSLHGLEAAVKHELSMSEARDRLTRLPEELAGNGHPEAITITRHGEPVLAVMPYELYESLVETLEVLADPDLSAQLRRSIEDARAGRTLPIDDLDILLAR